MRSMNKINYIFLLPKFLNIVSKQTLVVIPDPSYHFKPLPPLLFHYCSMATTLLLY